MCMCVDNKAKNYSYKHPPRPNGSTKSENKGITQVGGWRREERERVRNKN